MNKVQQDSVRYEVDRLVQSWPWWIKLLVLERLRAEGIEDTDISRWLDEV